MDEQFLNDRATGGIGKDFADKEEAIATLS